MSPLSRFVCRSAALALLAITASSCSELRAPAVDQSPFLAKAPPLKDGDDHSPFLRNWTSPDAAAVLQKRPNIYIAPINLAYLRPIKRSMAASAFTPEERQAAAIKLASYANSKIADAFAHSPSPRYKLVSKPDRNAITLEVAMVELNPNVFLGGALRTAVNAAAAPGVDSVILKSFKANIAIEGMVTDAATNKPVFAFADNQENKSALILSVNDFKTYGQARQAIDEWARQIEETLRTPASHRVSKAAAFIILPWH